MGRVRCPVVDVDSSRKFVEIYTCRDLDFASNAATIDGIIGEPETTTVSERAGRWMVHETEDSFERLRGDGHYQASACRVAASPDRRALMVGRSTNIVPVAHKVSRAERHAAAGHGSGVLWFTGLSASGKTTLALGLEQRLFERGYLVYVLDGDNIRKGLNSDLGFTPDDRAENIRRIGELAALFADAGFIVITSFISPYRTERERARMAAGEAFHEIYVAADLATCERRDPKGLYRKARAGTISDFTGISAPYEPPEAAELIVDTAKLSVEDCLDRLMAYVDTHFARIRRRPGAAPPG